MAEATDRLKKFQTEFESAFQNHSKYCEYFRRNRAVYKGTRESENIRDTNSKLRVKWAWQQIQSEIPRIMTVDPSFDFEPVEESDRDYSEALQHLVKTWLYKDKFALKQIPIIEMGAVEALSVTKTTWRRTTKKMKVRNAASLAQKALKKDAGFTEKEVIIENRPVNDPCDIFDVFWNPDAVCFETITKVFHRTWKSMDELKDLEKKGAISGVSDIKPLNEWGYQQNYNVDNGLGEHSPRRKDRYPVIERWDKTDNTLMIVCGDAVLFDGANPYYHCDLPFSFFCTQPETFRVVGMSECEAIEHIQEAIWTVDNQRIDAVSLAINNPLIADPQLEDQDIVFGPGEIIYANNAHRIEQLRFDANQIPALNETQTLIGHIQQMTGMNPYMIGSDPSSSGVDQNTAYGARTLTEAGNQRMVIKNTAFQIFQARIAKLMVQLSHQYLNRTELQQLLGERAADFPDMTPESIPMFLDVRPRGVSDQMSKLDKIDSLMQVINVSSNLHLAPMGDGTVFTARPFVEEIIDAHGLSSVNAFVPEPQMPMEEPPVEEV